MHGRAAALCLCSFVCSITCVRHTFWRIMCSLPDFPNADIARTWWWLAKAWHTEMVQADRDAQD